MANPTAIAGGFYAYLVSTSGQGVGALGTEVLAADKVVAVFQSNGIPGLDL